MISHTLGWKTGLGMQVMLAKLVSSTALTPVRLRPVIIGMPLTGDIFTENIVCQVTSHTRSLHTDPPCGII